MHDSLMPSKIPIPSGFSSSKIDEEKLKSYTIKDLIWSLKVLSSFREAKESLYEILKVLAEAGIDTSKINWNDPFSVMNAFLKVKGMGINIDIDEIIERMNSIEEVSFADINKALDIIETFLALSGRAEKIAKSMAKRGYTAKEFDMLMGLLGIGNAGIDSGMKVNVEDEYSDEDEEIELTEEELNRIKSIVNKYRNNSANQ